MDSSYFDTASIAKAVAGGRHREIVGGAWDEIGPLQLSFLRKEGLTPKHKLLDIGCGCLRGGIHFIRYLDPKNYFGIDISQSLLDAGYEIEVPKAGLQERLPRRNLRCTAEFEVADLADGFDFAIAQSLFTHLSFNRIRQCLERLAPAMSGYGVFYATFFERPDFTLAGAPLRHEPGGVVTYGERDPYHYSFADLQYSARGLPWMLRYIGEWGHPRGQRMAVFLRK